MVQRFCTIFAGAILAGSAVFSIVRAGDSDAPTTAPSTEPTSRPVAMNHFCPVQPDNPVDPRGPTVTRDGQVIGFCCPDCLDVFNRDPDKYMAMMK